MQSKWFSTFLYFISFSVLFFVPLCGQAAAVSDARGKFILSFDYLQYLHKFYHLKLLPNGPGGFCSAFTANLNQFHKIKLDTCSPRLSPKYPRFSRPEWQEIPLDMALAKNLINIHHGHWTKWLMATKTMRATGKVKMWQLRADIFHDGHPIKVIRLSPAFRGYPKPLCQYFDSDQMLVDNSNSAIKLAYAEPLYPLVSTLGNDMIYDNLSKQYYILEWSLIGSAYAESENVIIPDYLEHGGITHPVGVKGNVMVFMLKREGPTPICWINWLPTHTVKR